MRLSRFGMHFLVSGSSQELRWVRKVWRLQEQYYTRQGTGIRSRPLYVSSKEGVYLPIGLLEAFIYGVSQSEYSIQEYDPQLFPKPDFPLLPRWEEILRPDQQEGLRKLLKHSNGILRAYTGWGKTEVQLAIAESYLEAHPEDYVVVMVPSHAIREEWESRMRRWSFSHRDRVLLIIPQGFVRSKSSEEVVRILQERVRMVIADEMHHLSAPSWNAVLQMVRNLRYSYGFSATPDPERDASTDPREGFPFNADPTFALRVGMTGPIRYAVTANHVKSATVMILEMGNPWDGTVVHDSYLEALEDLFESIPWEQIPELFRPEDRVYIPVKTIEQGLRLHGLLNSKGYPTAFWKSGYILGPAGESMEFEELKGDIERGRIRFLVTTSVAYEGVDFPSVSGVVLYQGSNWRMVLQPLGRARAKEVKVLIPFHHQLVLLRKSSVGRADKILKDYRLKEIRAFNLKEGKIREIDHLPGRFRHLLRGLIPIA